MTARLTLICHGSTDAVRSGGLPQGRTARPTTAKLVRLSLSDVCRASIAVGPVPNCGPAKPPKHLD